MEQEGLSRDGQKEAWWKRNRLIERYVVRHTKPFHMQQRNTCVGRLLASSGPTTLSFTLTIKFKKRVQGIGVAIGGVNAKLLLFPVHTSATKCCSSLRTRSLDLKKVLSKKKGFEKSKNHFCLQVFLVCVVVQHSACEACRFFNFSF